MRVRFIVLILITVVIMAGFLAAPVTARGTSINDIEPGDTIFIYEEGLDLSGLRDPVTQNPITSLNRYAEDDPDKALINMVPVDDDTDFDVLPSLFDDSITRYYAYSNADGATTAAVFIVAPSVTITPVLARPNHNEVIDGISVPMGTAIAFRIDAPYVGSLYRAGGDPAAEISFLITKPDGSQSTNIGGSNLADLPVGSVEFYTDDSGMPGASVLSDLAAGTYTIVAQWSAPDSFVDRAPDSNAITFFVGDRVGIDVTSTATSATTSATAVATTTATTAPTSTSGTVTSTATTVPTLTTATATTVPPTTTSAAAPITILAAAFLVFLVVLHRR